MCRDCTFKDSLGNGKCSTCGPNTVSTGPRANRTACACSPGFEPGVQDGPDVEGGSCVAECGPGEEGSQGFCSPCKSGQFKNVSGEKCFSCPATQSASPTGNTQESRCSCPYNTINVQAADMTVIDRLGPFLQDSIQSITVENTLLHAPDKRRIIKLSLVLSSCCRSTTCCDSDSGRQTRLSVQPCHVLANNS